jgi:hypothetical protein
VAETRITRDDVESALGARQELGAGGVQGMIVAWAGIVGVNVAQRLKR